MKQRTLPGTDLTVSEVCLGTMTWGQQNSEADAHAQLDHALSTGVNFIDTAEMYPVPPNATTQGRTETYLGNWLTRRPRDGLVIATKVAGPGRRDWIRNGRTDLTRDVIAEAVDTSLARLKTDYIDLFQIHWPQRNVPMFGATTFDPTLDKGDGPSVVSQVVDRLNRERGIGDVIAPVPGVSVSADGRTGVEESTIAPSRRSRRAVTLPWLNCASTFSLRR